MQSRSCCTAADEGLLQIDQAGRDGVDRLAHPEPQIGRNLIVAAASGVQLAADVPQPVDQGSLDVHVHVFELDAELEFALLNLAANLFQPLHNLLALGGRDQTDLCQHLGMGDRAADVLRVETPVEAHAFGELFDTPVGRLGKDATPGLARHDSHFCSNRGTGVKMQQDIHCKRLTTKCQRPTGSLCHVTRHDGRAYAKRDSVPENSRVEKSD